ncbi:MAG: short-chain dehydrogenase [Paenibacillaceae bacterium]|jgi:NAD(P)-dependent dehydrogenase (short-subunit alcohol dehydrogenase family)|nr:short-chain dehydrogenase [Paenibacillaceae bacterium]
MDVQGKTIVVTGSCGGMGSVLCDRLAQHGARLALCSKDAAGLERQAEELHRKYKTIPFFKGVDITSEQEVKAFFEEAGQTLGRFDALANLAGLSIPGKLTETEEGTFDTIMDVNVKGSFLAGKYFALNAAEDASIIVNIGSMAARKANANAPLYCTAKAAVNMLSEAMLLQMGARNIRVTTINPGGADTPFWGERVVDRTKLMKTEEVVEVIMFVLASNPTVQIHSIDFESAARFR